MKKRLPESPFSFHRGISFGNKRKCSGAADLGTKRLTLTEVTGHGPLGYWVKGWRTIRAGINAGLTADASFFICYHRIGSGGTLSRTRGADIHARWLLTVLTDSWHED